MSPKTMEELWWAAEAHSGPLANDELGQYCATCNTSFVGNEMNFRDCPNCNAAMAYVVAPSKEAS